MANYKAVSTSWKKGQSGNPGGKRQHKLFRDALMRSVLECKGDKKKIDIIADKITSMAMKGDLFAMRELFDRIDGRVPQPIAGADTEQPTMLVVSWAKPASIIENDNDIPLLELKSHGSH
jgi:hypothetical protein